LEPGHIRKADSEGDMVAKKKWSELSSRNRRLITVLGAVEVVLMAVAMWDIKRRPAEQIKGPKWLWRSLAFVSFVGPLAYFALGRRRREAVH
jgi:hypothetical protein